MIGDICCTVLLVGIALICVLFVFFGRTLLDLFDVEDADYIWRYLRFGSGWIQRHRIVDAIRHA